MSVVTAFLNLVKPAPLENFSRATYNNNLDLIDDNAAANDKKPKGLLYYITLNTDPGAPDGISTKVVIHNIASFTFVGGRKYRVGWTSEYSTTNSDTYGEIAINKAATADAAAETTGLTLYNKHTISAKTANSSEFFHHFFLHTPSATETVQVKFTCERVVGSGGINLSGSAANRPIEFFIEDLGAQF